jgi:DNA-3-methyladenine glycosylase
MTPRNGSLFLERGHAYVYLVYGVSFLLNVTSEKPGVGAGVLLRAVEPLDGIELMDSTLRRKQLADIGRGPGRLTTAMQVDLTHDGLDLCSASSPLWVDDFYVGRSLCSPLGPPRPFRVEQSAGEVMSG